MFSRSSGRHSLKFYKRLNLYKASNVTFNPVTKEAFSYNWWKFTKVIEGKLVFNSYSYSPSTCKHQYKVKDVLRHLNLAVSCDIEAPDGLDKLPSALLLHKAKLHNMREKVLKARKVDTRLSYEASVRYHLEAIVLIQGWIEKGY